METFIAVCLAVLVVEITVLVIALVMTLLQIKRAAQAVEVLTYRIDHQIEAFGATVSSGWFSLAQGALRLFGRFFK
ncbi:MAG: hypothetical protein WC881_09035 [Elusimicrobiota bacterium]|jgi:hypothetical protein